MTNVSDRGIKPETQGETLLRIRDESSFLLDRLSELEWSDIPEDFWRDWNGHVEPSIARLRKDIGGDD
jgi:hypothetical protein